MKMIGGGAAGLGAAALLPSAAGFTFKDDKPFKFGNLTSTDTNLEIKPNGNLNLKQNNVSEVGSLTSEELWGKPENGTDSSILQKHHRDALNDGYAVGWGPNYHTVIDPRDYSDDSKALQALNDELVNNIPEGSTAIIWIPGHRPDGNSYVLDRTVICGGSSTSCRIVPKGWNHSSVSGARIESAINDGSPMFLLENDSNFGFQLQHHIIGDGMTLNAQSNDCEGIRLNDVVQFGVAHIHFQSFVGGENQGALRFDGTCFNGWVDDINWGGGDGTADCISLTNEGGSATNGDETPGEIRYGSKMNLSKGGFARGIVSHVNASKQMWLGGRIEGATGEASFHFKDGQLVIGSGSELGAAEGNNTNHVTFDGRNIVVAPDIYMGRAGGNGIEITTDTLDGMISQQTFVSPNISGDVIKIDSSPGSNYHLLVPRAEQISDGTVSYPSPSSPWIGMKYLDGWQPFRSGTNSISANSTVKIESFASIDVPIRASKINIQDAETDAIGVTPVYGWRESSGTDGQQSFGFHNFSASELTVAWELERLSQ